MNSFPRDRVRALQLLADALPIVREDDRKDEVANFYLNLANTMQQSEHGGGAWRLQHLTDLASCRTTRRATPTMRPPKGAGRREGKPVFHKLPARWEAAASDGERWRWALAQAAENAPQQMNETRWLFAEFLWQQFGVHTMADGFLAAHPMRRQGRERHIRPAHAGRRRDDRRLATGIKRFKLPDEFNYIKILQQIAEQPQTGIG